MATTQSPALTQLSDCCIKGFKHTGNPSGKIIKLADLQTYLAEPTTSATQGPKKVLLFLSDVYGSLQINAKLLQDHFAQYVNPSTSVCNIHALPHRSGP